MTRVRKDARDVAVQAEAEVCGSASATPAFVARYASNADRQAAYRRRLVGLRADFPRQDNRHGRTSLLSAAVSTDSSAPGISRNDSAYVPPQPLHPRPASPCLQAP